MYEWIKALHVIAVISWMAGMLYLPRLFVYHCEAETGSKQSETFKVMERRLLKAIINPAMIVTWLAGLYLAWAGHWFSAGWLHGKLLLVVVLSGSNWPVELMGGTYEQSFHTMRAALLPLTTPAERAAVYGGNAAAFYRVR